MHGQWELNKKYLSIFIAITHTNTHTNQDNNIYLYISGLQYIYSFRKKLKTFWITASRCFIFFPKHTYEWVIILWRKLRYSDQVSQISVRFSGQVSVLFNRKMNTTYKISPDLRRDFLEENTGTCRISWSRNFRKSTFPD